MAVEGQEVMTISIPAGEDLSAKQYYGVALSAGTVVLASANTDELLGILQNAPESGGTAQVLLIGRSKYVAGAAIAAGARLGVQADGQFETLAAANPTRYWFGRSIDAPGAAAVIGSGIFNFVLPQAALTAN